MIGDFIKIIKYRFPDFIGLNGQEEMILRALIVTRYLKGDYYEFGVYKGDSIIPASIMAKNNNLKMRFFGFDSFNGLPNPRKEEIEFEKGSFNVSKKYTINRINYFKAKEIKLIKGFFEKTLNEKTKEDYKMEKAKIVYIDSDLYKSCKEALNFSKSLLQDGTIIMFDDWYCFGGKNNRGEQKAIKEWLLDNKDIKLNEFMSFSWTGKAFFVEIK